MKKIFGWIGIVLGSLIGLLLIAGVVLYFVGESRLNTTYDFPRSNITIPTDADSIEFGRHRAQTLCLGCHGEDMSGLVNFFDGGPLGTLDSANVTAGKGGVGQLYTSDEDYVRAIRHGIDPQGKPIFMPGVVSTANLSDEDLGAIIAYIKTLPPVDRELNGENFSPLAKMLLAAGVLGKLPVEAVSHEVHVTAPARGVTPEYGKYMVDTHDCRVCHGPELNGGKHVDPTIAVISPNLTPGGHVAFWTEEQFVSTIKNGMTPGGHQLNNELMPWKDFARMTDDELRAIFLYLQSLPKLQQYTE